jgi:uncharacterized protein
MRRKEREVTGTLELNEILSTTQICRIALKDEEGLYIVPLNFGYELSDNKLTFYFHSAKTGRKLSAIKKDGQVAFEMDTDHRLISADKACDYGFAYASIIGRGHAEIVSDLEEKKKGLSLLMKHQTGKDFVFDDKSAASVTVWKVIADQFTGKRHQ